MAGWEGRKERGREGGCISWVTAISRNMPLASLSTFGIRRKGGGETEKQRGKFLEKRATIALPLEVEGASDDGRRDRWMPDAGCCMMERNSRRKKERLISRRLFLGVSLKGVFMRSLWSLV